MFTKLLCWWSGHRRGKRIAPLNHLGGYAWFRCPRCGEQWTRKVKP